MKTNQIAIKITLGIVLSVIIFHLFILIKVIPYEITWGGRLKSENEMYVFESISILVNLFLTSVLLMKGGYIKHYIRPRTTNIILWFFLFLFILNTIGNVFAKTNFEKLFAVITLIFAILIGFILKKK